MKKAYRIAAILTCFFILLIASAQQAQAQVEYNQRDYMAERSRSHYGAVPIIGKVYGLSPNDTQYKKLVTFNMRKHRGILVEIEPLRQPAGILLLASQPATPRNLKPVWRETNLSHTIRFWTDRYWFPLDRCSTMGCPRMTFEATDGAVEVRIINVKPDLYKDEYPGM